VILSASDSKCSRRSVVVVDEEENRESDWDEVIDLEYERRD
jgi:hypothetical protein